MIFFPACLDVHERHRHEFGSQRFSRVFTSGYMLTFKSKPFGKLFSFRRSIAGLSKVNKQTNKRLHSIIFLLFDIFICANLFSIYLSFSHSLSLSLSQDFYIKVKSTVLLTDGKTTEYNLFELENEIYSCGCVCVRVRFK